MKSALTLTLYTVAFVLVVALAAPARALSSGEVLLFRHATAAGTTTVCQSGVGPRGQPALFFNNSISALSTFGFNDVASSFRANGNWTFWEHDFYGGQPLVRNGVTYSCNLHGIAFPGGGDWGDAISSVERN